MLKDIEIQNFRCFEKTKISDFAEINLIGGKNNAGKTALLEALLLANFPNSQTILFLKQTIRKESPEVSKLIPDQAYDNFFFKKDQKISLLGNYDQEKKRVEILLNDLTNTNIFHDENSYKRIMELIANSGKISDILEINFLINLDEQIPIKGYHYLIATSEGILTDKIKKFIDSNNLPMIPSFSFMSNKDLTMEFDKARLAEKEEELLKAFQILDQAIIKVESFSIGEPNLYITKQNQKRLPLSLFGDGINRVANIILKLINNNSKILLIDEIENGIHYTNQREFWRLLFRLAIELDVQIFATTHSGEMIEAFTDVCLEKYPENGAYFELTRKAKTNQIIAIKRDPETLMYALEHNRGVRGE